MKSKSEINKSVESDNSTLVKDVKFIIQQAREQAYSAVNSAMVQAYWLIGRRIVIDEQAGQKRAEYGKQIIHTLAKELTTEFGKGFDEREIRKIRQFYLTFPIRDAVSPEFEIRLNYTGEKQDAVSPVLKMVQETVHDSNKNVFIYLFTRLNWTHIRLQLEEGGKL